MRLTDATKFPKDAAACDRQPQRAAASPEVSIGASGPSKLSRPHSAATFPCSKELALYLEAASCQSFGFSDFCIRHNLF